MCCATSTALCSDFRQQALDGAPVEVLWGCRTSSVCWRWTELSLSFALQQSEYDTTFKLTKNESVNEYVYLWVNVFLSHLREYFCRFLGFCVFIQAELERLCSTDRSKNAWESIFFSSVWWRLREKKHLQCTGKGGNLTPTHTHGVYYHELLLAEAVCPHLLDSHRDLTKPEWSCSQASWVS